MACQEDYALAAASFLASSCRLEFALPKGLGAFPDVPSSSAVVKASLMMVACPCTRFLVDLTWLHEASSSEGIDDLPICPDDQPLPFAVAASCQRVVFDSRHINL